MDFTGPPITVPEIAVLIGKSKGWVYAQRDAGKFPRPLCDARRNKTYRKDEVLAYMREGQPNLTKWNREHWGEP